MDNIFYWRLNFLLATRFSLLFALCSFLVTFSSLLVARCSLLFARCSLPVTFCSLLVDCYFLLVTFCSLLFARCSLLFARCSLFFRPNYCKIKLLWEVKIWFDYNETPPQIFSLQISEIFVTFSGHVFIYFYVLQESATSVSFHKIHRKISALGSLL